MKCKRHILVDSSTKRSKGSGWGRSAACWALFYGADKTPDKIGLLYAPQEGPNRMFIWGVLSALEYRFNLYEIDYELIVKGDCKCAIDVLNGTSGHNQLKGLFDLTKSLEKRLKSEKDVDVRYEYLPRADALYQSIDRCAKDVSNFIEQRFSLKKRQAS